MLIKGENPLNCNLTYLYRAKCNEINIRFSVYKIIFRGKYEINNIHFSYTGSQKRFQIFNIDFG